MDLCCGSESFQPPATYAHVKPGQQNGVANLPICFNDMQLATRSHAKSLNANTALSHRFVSQPKTSFGFWCLYAGIPKNLVFCPGRLGFERRDNACFSQSSMTVSEFTLLSTYMCIWSIYVQRWRVIFCLTRRFGWFYEKFFFFFFFSLLERYDRSLSDSVQNCSISRVLEWWTG